MKYHRRKGVSRYETAPGLGYPAPLKYQHCDHRQTDNECYDGGQFQWAEVNDNIWDQSITPLLAQPASNLYPTPRTFSK